MDDEDRLLSLSIVEPSKISFQYTTERSSFLTNLLNIFILLISCPILIFFLILMYFSSFFRRKVGTTYAFRKTQFNLDLVSKLQETVGHYSPPWWYNLHLGSLLPFGKSPNLLFERQIFIHSDNTEFAVDWYPESPRSRFGKEQNESGTIITLFLPGLGLSSDANIAQAYSKCHSSIGNICGIIVPRGHPTSKIPWKTLKPWHGDCTDDLKLVLHELKNFADIKSIQLKVFLAGYSASTNIIAMTLSDLSTEKVSFFSPESTLEIIGAMLVCANYDYVDTMHKLEANFVGNIYSRLLVTQFKMFFESNSQLHNQLNKEQLQSLRSAQLISEYDKAAYNLYGYSSLDEMYMRLSPKHILNKIKCPIITIVAEDDPLYLFSHGSVQKGIPLEKYTSNPNFFFMSPSHGNHFGFYDGSLLEIYSNKISYIFPPKVSIAFTKLILEYKLNEKINEVQGSSYEEISFVLKNTYQ